MSGPATSSEKPALIAGIAAHLGVSIATVSLVLNGKAQQGRISDAVAQRVLAYVEEIGYKPNQVARSLRTGKSGLIGLLVANVADPPTACLVALIEKLAFAQGYQLLLGSTNNDAEKARKYLTLFRERRAEVYLIAPCLGIEEEVKDMMRAHLPLVLLEDFTASTDLKFN
jgi:LacI family transcriptional regulator